MSDPAFVIDLAAHNLETGDRIDPCPDIEPGEVYLLCDGAVFVGARHPDEFTAYETWNHVERRWQLDQWFTDEHRPIVESP